jgi:hypothetical protein
MNFYREPEHATTDNVSSIPRCSSRRELVTTFLNRLSWCGLTSASLRPSVAEKASKEFSNLASYATPRDITDAIARRQHIAKHLREAGAPEVGVFWFVQEPGGVPEIIASSVVLQQGKAYGIYIDSPEDHVTFWGTMNRAMSPLLGSGPEDWPRGRVLFNTAMRHFEVDLTRQLVAPQFRAEILACFHLLEASTVFKSDPHYAETRFTFGPQGPLDRLTAI